MIDWYLRRRSSEGSFSEHDLYEQAKRELAAVYKDRFKQVGGMAGEVVVINSVWLDGL